MASKYAGATVIAETPLMLKLETPNGEDFWVTRARYETEGVKQPVKQSAKPLKRSKPRGLRQPKRRFDFTDVAKLRGDGASHKGIAATIGCSLSTVERLIREHYRTAAASS
jgi:hypothetical protein